MFLNIPSLQAVLPGEKEGQGESLEMVTQWQYIVFCV